MAKKKIWQTKKKSGKWRIGKWCKEQDIAFHVDISNTWGRFYFSFKDIPVDFITLNSEQIYGPKGAGFVWINPKHDYEPMIVSGPDHNFPLQLHACGLCHARSDGCHQRLYISARGARLYDNKISMTVTDACAAVRQSFQSCFVDDLPGADGRSS